MAYVALYRLWRPQRFGDVVAQEHVARTLKNAIAGGRLSHAYLFTGPRGTGKTSTAKILAKAVNCLQQAGDGEPCNQCGVCQRITAGVSLDVLEIDGASNRGIDEIRDLRDKVKYAPAEGRYRVYIIDEVHMLTTEAFNGLLKTLEEPPAHVLFVLATTEPHKLPATILSRCQRFDFKRIGPGEIRRRLVEVAEEGGYQVEPAALDIIARVAAGGLRDALSLLDQCLAYAGPSVTRSDVAAVLGSLGEDLLAELVGAVAVGDSKRILEIVEIAFEDGKDLRRLANDLIAYLRDLLLGQVCRTEMAGKAQDHYGVATPHLTAHQLEQAIEVLCRAEADMRWSNHPRVVLELGLLRAARSVACGPAILETGQEQASPSNRGSKRPSGEGGLVPATREGTANPWTVRRDRAEDGPVSGPKAIELPLPGEQQERANPAQTRRDWESEAKPQSGSVSYDMEAMNRPQAKDAGLKRLPGQDSLLEPYGHFTPLSGNRSAATGSTRLDLEAIRKRWPEVLEGVKKARITAHALLLEAETGDFRDGTLTLIFPSARTFHKERLEQPENRQAVEQVLQKVLRTQVKVMCAFDQTKLEPVGRSENLNPADHPAVKMAVEVLGGEVVSLRE